jgi:protease PrsW
VLRTINRVFVGFILLAAVAGILVSIVMLAIPSLLESSELGGKERPDFLLGGGAPHISPQDSPAELNFTIHTPPLGAGDLLSLDIYETGHNVAHVDCLSDEAQNYSGATSLMCAASLPYIYSSSGTYDVIAVFTTNDTDYSSGPRKVAVDWSAYESNFWGAADIMLLLVAVIYVVVILPVFLFVIWTASKMKHEGAEEGRYSLHSLIFLTGKTLLQKSQSFLVSPYFWAFEAMGIIIILIYLAASAEMWKSGTAFVAFILSGLVTFIVPFLWCATWWYADYREREPLRIMVTFFLWGMLAALMAIGLNTVLGIVLAILGVGFLESFFLAPPIEELYKGAGLGLLAEHDEFNSIEDGILFGFTVGMGFSFVENWIYLLDNPLGSNLGAWLGVFFLRCILFSANHAFFTAITGAAIGWLIEKKFPAPALGMLFGVPMAAFFHTMHNSGETLIALLGGSGTLLYCCLLIPIFDYGGLLLLVALFIRSVLRQKAVAA